MHETMAESVQEEPVWRETMRGIRQRMRSFLQVLRKRDPVGEFAMGWLVWEFWRIPLRVGVRGGLFAILALWVGAASAQDLTEEQRAAVNRELAAGIVTVVPAAADGAVDNPLKGWCVYTDAGKIHQPYSMIFSYASWKELEPNQGDYRFEDWQKQWDVPQGAGKHVVLRVYADYPNKPSGMPDWLIGQGVKMTPYTQYGGGLSPDYNDPKMVAAMERLISAMGRRFNDDHRVAFIQLGLLGHWGEWHTFPRTELDADDTPRRRVIAAYRNAFPDKQLMVRTANGHAGTQDWIGFHDDMFPEDTDNGEDWSFLATIRRAGRDQNWRNHVIGGEMVPGKADQWLLDRFATTRQMVQRSHFSWVGPYGPALVDPKSLGDRANLFAQHSETLVREMGYDFQLTAIRHLKSIELDKPTPIAIKVRNRGVAPFYYPWPVTIALIDAQGNVATSVKSPWDIRSWQPDSDIIEKASISFSQVPVGEYQLALGIVDPWQNKPKIRFANDLEYRDGWTVVSTVRIE
ncbi:DUF4832 domain-containing protein [Stieleria varia]|nr:DUF4832 domain-containing protein [Stieleria varia]